MEYIFLLGYVYILVYLFVILKNKVKNKEAYFHTVVGILIILFFTIRYFLRNFVQ